MKKLMTVIAAVAMSFGLFADAPEAGTFYGTSFESLNVGSEGTTFDWLTAGWTYADGAENPALSSEDAQAVREACYKTGAARRDSAFFAPAGETNDQYLKLETGSNTLSKAVTAQMISEDGVVYFDQLVKFTGYEETPTLADGTKIAVWMSAIEEDATATPDPIVGETNLYVSVGNGLGETKNVLVDYTVQPDQWYRLTIKSIGPVFNSQLGFQIFINGEAVSTSDEYHGAAGGLSEKAKALYDKGQLFTAIDTESATLASVGFQGIGCVDDFVMSKDAPDFDQFVDVAATALDIIGAKVTLVTQGSTEIPLVAGKYTVKPGQKIVVTYGPNGAYVIKGAGYATYNVAADGSVTLVDDESDIEVNTAAVEITHEDESVEYFDNEDAVAALAADQLPVVNGDTVKFLETVEVLNEDASAFIYSFSPDTTIAVSAVEGVSKWDVFIGNTLDEEGITATANSLTYNAAIYPAKLITVSFDEADSSGAVGTFNFGGTQIAGTLIVDGAVTLPDEGTITLTGAGSLSTTTELIEAMFTTTDEGKAVYIDSMTEPGVYTAMLVDEAADVVEIVGGGKYKSLADALAAAQKGDELKLLDSIELTATTTVNADITLNLNGKTITGSWNTGIVGVGNREYIFELGASAVTVKGGTVSSTAANIGGFHTVGGTLTIAGDAVVDTAWRAVGVYNGATLNVAEGATLKTSNVDPTIMVIANGKKTTLNIDGIVQNTCSAETKAAADSPHNLDAAIMGNGNDTAADIVAMNIGATAQISATAAAGIYAPNAGTVTVADGAKITGFTYGIYAKSGNLVINGGAITATADTAVAPTAFNNGVNGQGYAVLLETGAAAGGYANNLVANIQGGKFTSTGAAVYNFDRSAAGDSPIAACISGGLFMDKPADALLVASTTAGYKAVWVKDTVATDYWTPGEEAITYNITYKNADGTAFIAWATGYTAPTTFTVAKEETLPVAGNIDLAVLGVGFNNWTNAENVVIETTAGQMADLVVFANIKQVLDPVTTDINEMDPKATPEEVNTAKETIEEAAEAIGGNVKPQDVTAWLKTFTTPPKATEIANAKSLDVSYQLGANSLFTAEPKAEVKTFAQATEAATGKVGYDMTFEIKGGTTATPADTEAVKTYIATLVQANEAVDFAGTAIAITPVVTVSGTTISAKVEIPSGKAAAFMKVATPAK